MFDKKITKDSILLTISIILIIFDLFFWFLVLSDMPGRGHYPRDARRESDMRQISLAMEMYYDGEGKGSYLSSEFMPTAIGTYLNPMPKDTSGGPCSSYQWISNMEDPHKFCVWACLENGKFMITNQRGVRTLNKAPTDLNCGEEEITTACTQEAKICPDGSSVGRAGPNCEFSPCPATNTNETADWEIYENPSMSFSIKYNPAEWVWKKYEFSEKESSANLVLASKSLGMQLDYKDSYCFIQFIKSTPYNINTGEVPTFEDLVKSNKEGAEKMIEKIIKENINIAISKEVTEENIKVDGNSAVELSYIISTKVHRIFIPLSEEGETFQIGYYGYTTSNCEDMFYQMLSTFKFID